jgi:hypothetical protein
MPLTSKEQAFSEWGKGELHSGRGGPVVKKTPAGRRQAIAIALSTERRMKGKRAMRGWKR